MYVHIYIYLVNVMHGCVYIRQQMEKALVQSTDAGDPEANKSLVGQGHG